MKYEENLAHLFSFGEDFFLLDVNSGSIHQISEAAYRLVVLWREAACSLAALPALLQQAQARLSHGFSPEVGIADIEEICEGLEGLVKEGQLLSRAPGLEDYSPPQDYVVKALCLHVAHDCNLRCRYCFAGAGAFGGDRSLMSFAIGKQALDFLFDASGHRQNVEVDYFGGEPLMNFAVVKKLVLYGEKESRRRGKTLRQTLTTNGVLLQGDALDFLNSHDVALVLSLDGRPESHDKMRPTVGGQGSYQTVLPHLMDAVASRGGENYFIRGTYTGENKDFFLDVLHMVESGFRHISVEPVVAMPGETFAFREEDLPALLAQYESLARFMQTKKEEGEPFSFFHFQMDLDRGPCLPKRLSGCGAGCDYLAVSPEGALYPCHQFVGNKDFVMGDVGAGVLKPEIGKGFRESHVLAKEACRSCWARFYCSGGCHANAWNLHHDLHKPFALGCALEKKRLECAIWLIAKEADVFETRTG